MVYGYARYYSDFFSGFFCERGDALKFISFGIDADFAVVGFCAACQSRSAGGGIGYEGIRAVRLCYGVVFK